MILSTSLNQSGSPALEAGTYAAKLKAAKFHVGKVYQSEAREQLLELHWEIEGSEHPFVEKFVRFVVHEMSTLGNRLSALIGRDLTRDDKIDWHVAADATTGERIDDFEKATGIILSSRMEGVTGNLEDITVNGRSLIGRSCLLALKVSDSGYNRAGSQAANPLPVSMKKKEPPQPIRTQLNEPVPGLEDDDEGELPF